MLLAFATHGVRSYEANVLNNADRIAAAQAFQGAIHDAAQEYQATRSLPALQRHYEELVRTTGQAAVAAVREKRIMRLRLSALVKDRAHLMERVSWLGSGSTITDSQKINTLLRLLSHTAPGVSDSDPQLRRALVPVLTGSRDGQLLRSLGRFELTLWGQAATLDARITELRQTYDVQLASYRAAATAHSQALQNLQMTTDRIENIKQTVEEVHAEVIRMQSSLARIDAKIRARVERELIEKGLLAPGSIDHSQDAALPAFTWPVYGPLSAVFGDKAYEEHFAIPHRAIDIVVSQGSPVASAADGVVFLARDGGATGFSYLLIGHRGGYATLYGHLSRFTVSAGQDVRQGEIIGFSGGKPGTHGAGPMTTGPHLHFEVIQSGVNIDPKSVLP